MKDASQFNDRVIFAVIVDGIIARAWADEKDAIEGATLLKQFKSGTNSKVSNPIPVKFYDNHAIDSKRFDRVISGSWSA